MSFESGLQTKVRMSSILSKRFWRGVAIHVLPEFLKGPLRRNLQGYRNSKPEFDLRVEPAGDRLSVEIDRSIKFLLPQAMKDEIQHYFLGNADYAEEMAGFIAVSKDAALLFDVGAAHGLFSAVFCALSPGNRSVAYEPSSSWLSVFEPMVRLNCWEQRVTLVHNAIGNKQEHLQFYSDSSSGFIQVMSGGQSNQLVNVQATTLDGECARLNLQPDVLKIDVEGFELEALQGADKLLRTRRPAICLELHLNYLEERRINPKEICDLLAGHGYDLFSCHLEKLAANQIYDSIKPVVRFIAR
jgi:FkbM family methyltransferase